jgi:hypothetical protein
MPLPCIQSTLSLALVLEEFIYTPRHFRCIFQFALPNREYFPAFFNKDSFGTLIPRHIGIEFLLPKLRPRLRCRRHVTKIVPMPETTMNEDYLLLPCKNQIWATYKALAVQPIAIAHSMYKFADSHFGFGVLGMYRSHDCGTLRSIDMIRHQIGPRR